MFSSNLSYDAFIDDDGICSLSNDVDDTIHLSHVYLPLIQISIMFLYYLQWFGDINYGRKSKSKSVDVTHFMKRSVQSWATTYLGEYTRWLGLCLISFTVFLSLLSKSFVTFNWDFATHPFLTMSSNWLAFRSESESPVAMACNTGKCGGKIVLSQI